MFKIGCAEIQLEVPLFTELYGYGHFASRRNTGVYEPLYCRAFTFYDGKHRAVIVYSDLCTTDDQFARELRAQIATRLRIRPEGIAFTATHTHSGPAVSAESPDTSGIRNAGFIAYWKNTVLQVVQRAFDNEEEILSAETGKAPLERPIGTNRVEPDRNVTDPAIRWIRFKRADGSVKLLLHNHAAHGIADNGPLGTKVSSDWMGAANRMLKEQKCADFILYLQGAAGDINTRTACNMEKRPGVGRELGEEYVKYLTSDLENGTPLALGEISFVLRTFEFPMVEQTPAQLRKDAEFLRNKGRNDRERDYWGINALRLEEMALLLEKGYDLGEDHDLQIIRMGEVSIYFVPGELYIEPGCELLENSTAKHPFISTVSNGNGQYYFTEKSGERYPAIDCKPEKLFGFYEIYSYMHQQRFKYQNCIASFILERMRMLENEKEM